MTCHATLGTMQGAAVFGGLNNEYRYWLQRRWDPSLPMYAAILLNPARADATSSDGTLDRVIHFVHLHGAGGVEVVNLFALVDTKQTSLYSHSHPVGETLEETDEWIRLAIENTTAVLVGWGDGNKEQASRAGTNPAALIRPRVAQLKELLPRTGLFCVKAPTATGAPHHPGRLGWSERLREYEWPPDYPYPRLSRRPRLAPL
jgi:hypothetical protein